MEVACLCHGSAGLSLLYQRLWVATGDPFFRDQATMWFDRTLAIGEQGTGGIGGYRNFDNKRGQWTDAIGIVDGAAGIGLSLLAATSDVEPLWDRVMLLSLPHEQQS
jgi:hypothetical protein